MTSSSNLCIFMSNEEFLKLKVKDPLTTLKLLIESKSPSSFPSPGYPKKFNPNYFESAHQGLLKQF